MKKFVYLLFVFTLIIAFLGNAPQENVDAAHSASSADYYVNKFRVEACGGRFAVHGPGVASARCFLDHTNLYYSIRVPYPRLFSTNPEYGLAGVPFGLGLDWNPDTTGFRRFSETPVTYTISRRVKFYGFNVYAMLSPVDAGPTFNEGLARSKGNNSNNDNVRIKYDGDIGAEIGGNKVTAFAIDANELHVENLAGMGFAIEKNLIRDFGGLDRGPYLSYQIPEALKEANLVNGNIYSLEDYEGEPSTQDYPVYFRTGNNDPSHYAMVTGLSSFNSSSGDSIDGEPAYGVSFDTTWHLYTKVEWTHYDRWDVVGEDCDLDYWGNIIPESCEDVYGWVRDGGAFETDWIKNGSITLHDVYDTRSGRYVDSVPFLVYQAQVLLEE